MYYQTAISTALRTIEKKYELCENCTTFVKQMMIGILGRSTERLSSPVRQTEMSYKASKETLRTGVGTRAARAAAREQREPRGQR